VRAAELLRAVLDAVLPPRCIACDAEIGAAADGMCPACAVTVHPIGRRGCRKCGAEPPAGTAPRPRRCRRCRDRRFAFRRAVAAARYARALRDAVLAVKFGGRREGTAYLGDLVADAVLASGVGRGAGLVVPVPLHPTRRLVRGFDQAELLARRVARRLGLPCASRALRRRRRTRAQAAAPPGARAANLRDAFGPGLQRRSARGRRVLLVDDVLSTGATVDAAARALLALGARSVDVAVAAT
jgi:ComF family protein